MDGSCIEQESTTSGSPSISFRQEQPCSLAVKEQLSPPASLCRMGSGTSVVLDLDGGTEAESGRRLPSSRFKGVVSQPNGRWGAQIYEKHQRVWLGTFNDEAEAAKTYDVAAQRFRGRDAITNFKPSEGNPTADEAESVFLTTHSKAEIVDMLRKHTYKDELEQARKNLVDHCAKFSKDKIDGFQGSDQLITGQLIRTSDRLFEKTVTPSDVGKLNRLVIPKQHAEKHFPLQNASASKGVLLNLKDVNGKVWRFRYSYWNSSQSYVLTKGWSRFVKEKQLRAGDVVSFHRSACPDKQLFIDWKKKSGSDFNKTIEPVLGPSQPVPFRLFGVNIFKTPTTGDKRIREIDFFTVECKKPKYL